MLEVQRTRDVQLANEELQQRLWQAEHLNQTLTLQNEELARANKSTEKKLVEMQARLDGKIAELKDAATFLSMTDDVPDSEVERIVQALNANIFQTAARISDEPRLSSRRHMRLPPSRRRSYHRMRLPSRRRMRPLLAHLNMRDTTLAMPLLCRRPEEEEERCRSHKQIFLGEGSRSLAGIHRTGALHRLVHREDSGSRRPTRRHRMEGRIMDTGTGRPKGRLAGEEDSTGL